MKKLIVLSGVPGSGKSYFANEFRKTRGMTGHVYVVSSDTLRYEVTGNQQNLSFDKLVWKIFYGFAKVYSMDPDAIVILDATNIICKYRVGIVEPFRKMYDQIDLVSFNLDKDLVRYQNLNRLFPIPEETLEDLFKKFELPNNEDRKFFDHVYEILDHNILPIINKI